MAVHLLLQSSRAVIHGAGVARTKNAVAALRRLLRSVLLVKDGQESFAFVLVDDGLCCGVHGLSSYLKICLATVARAAEICSLPQPASRRKRTKARTARRTWAGVRTGCTLIVSIAGLLHQGRSRHPTPRPRPGRPGSGLVGVLGGQAVAWLTLARSASSSAFSALALARLASALALRSSSVILGRAALLGVYWLSRTPKATSA